MGTVLNDETLTGGMTLALAGGAVSLTGAASLSGVVQGSGTLTLESGAVAGLGDGQVFDNDAVFVVDGTATQGFHVEYGTAATDNAQLVVAADGTYIMLANLGDAEGIDGNISGSLDSGTITNLGVFEEAGATSAAFVSIDFDNAGTIFVARGTLQLAGVSNIIGGTVAGSGELDLRSGSTTLAGGAVVDVGTLGVYGGNTQLILQSNETFAGAFDLYPAATLDLDAQTLTLTGNDALLGSVDGGGVVVVDGDATTNNLVLSENTDLVDAGTIGQASVVFVSATGGDQATLSIAASGTYDFLTDNNIMANGAGTIVNAGTFAKIGADGVSAVQPAFINQGQVIAASGEIDFNGTLVNDATLTAAAASIVINGALTEQGQGLLDLAQGGTIDLKGSADAAETFAFTGTAATLILNAPKQFLGTIAGFAPGDTIDLAGIQANGVSETGGTLVVSETSNSVMQASYTLAVSGLTDAAALTLIDDNSGGTAIVLNHVGTAFTNPSGTIIADNWKADASGNWSSGANWFEVVNGATIFGQPSSFNDAVVTPSGSLAFVVTYDETDTVNQIGGGSTGTLAQTGGLLRVNDGGNWYGGFLETGGTFDAVSGWNLAGIATLAPGATAEVDSGIFVVGGGTLAGSLVGQGAFSTSNDGSLTIAPGFSITAATWNDSSNFYNTTLDTGVSYAGSLVLNDYGADFDLNGNTLTLSGNADLNGGSIEGSGLLALTGITELGQLSLSNTVTAMVVGTVVESSGLGLAIGEGATPDDSVLDITSTGTWDFVEDAPINAGSLTPIDNAGLIEKSGGVGISLIQGPSFVDTGSIDVASGSIEFGASNNAIAGAVGGSGELILGRGLNFPLNYTLDAGTTITTPTLEFAGGSNIFLDTSLAYAGDLQLFLSASSLTLNGNTLTLTGVDQIDAGNNANVTGNGEILVAGTASIEALRIVGGATLTVTGQVVQDGGFELGSSATDISGLEIGAGGTWNLVDDTAIGGAAASTIVNAGLIEKSGGVSMSSISAGSLVNTGTILAAIAGTDLTGPVSGAGLLTIGAGAGLELDGTVAGQTVDFSGVGTLLLTDAIQFAGTIAGFAAGDTIDLSRVAYQAGTTPTLTTNDQLSFTEDGTAYAFQLAGAYGGVAFKAMKDAGSGTDLAVVACFTTGTHLAREHGTVPVEALTVGDGLRTIGGAIRPVRWIGHRRVNVAAHPRPELVRPVRIRHDAFADGVPQRDLLLSPDHAVYLDGVLIPVKHLLNGRSIVQESVATVEYWHVELDGHDVLLAENLAAESYLDTGNRAAFANGGAHIRLHPAFSPLSWDDACAELVEDGPRLVAAKQRLFERVGAGASPVAALSVFAGHRLVPAEVLAPGLLRFAPGGAGALHLVSPGWTPAFCHAASLDRRPLGVRIFDVAVDGRTLDLQDAALVSGFHPLEATAEGWCRWTDGDARLLVPPGAETVVLRVDEEVRPLSSDNHLSEKPRKARGSAPGPRQGQCPWTANS